MNRRDRDRRRNRFRPDAPSPLERRDTPGGIVTLAPQPVLSVVPPASFSYSNPLAPEVPDGLAG